MMKKCLLMKTEKPKLGKKFHKYLDFLLIEQKTMFDFGVKEETYNFRNKKAAKTSRIKLILLGAMGA